MENVAERELQSLYAVQALVTKRQHPKGSALECWFSGDSTNMPLLFSTRFDSGDF